MPANQQKTNGMKTNRIIIDRAIPWLGLGLITGVVILAATYLGFEQKTRSAEASTAMLDRLFHGQQLSAALKKIHDGEAAAAAQNLDLLLCGDILLINAELPSADPETRALVQKAFQRIAKTRPKTEGADPDPMREHVVDQVAAERVLALALATDGVAASSSPVDLR
jgi:hypothetical protein